MNRTSPTGGRLAPLRASLLLALLAATALLAGGAQALAPAPAAAAVNQGEGCDPNYPTADCEPTNGGGGGGSSSGSTQAGGTGDSEIIGEPIYVEGTLPPSPCGAFCLPSQVGRSHTGFLDRGGKDPRAPRPRGRLTRVGEVAKEKGKGKKSTSAKEECQQLWEGKLPRLVSLNAEIEKLGAWYAPLANRLGLLERRVWALEAEMRRRQDVMAKLRVSYYASGYLALQQALEMVKGERDTLAADINPMKRELDAKLDQRHDIWESMSEKCNKLSAQNPLGSSK